MKMILENKNKTIYEIIFKNRNIVLDMFFITVSVFFLGVLSNIRIPLWPVPITMQTFGVFLIAFFFGYKKGFISILTYILAGILGFSVFSGSKSGIAVLIGPTGGYLIGFLAAVLIVGYLVQKGFGRTKLSVIYCMVLGNLVIYLFGIIGLKVVFPSMGLLDIIIVGIVPFILGDIIKIIIAAMLFPYVFAGLELFNSQ